MTAMINKPIILQEIIKQNCQPLVEALPFLRNAHPDLIEAITTQARLAWIPFTHANAQVT